MGSQLCLKIHKVKNIFNFRWDCFNIKNQDILSWDILCWDVFINILPWDILSWDLPRYFVKQPIQLIINGVGDGFGDDDVSYWDGLEDDVLITVIIGVGNNKTGVGNGDGMTIVALVVNMLTCKKHELKQCKLIQQLPLQ